ncbi:hypothetical protein K5V21_06190 [Clostridium sardiniense]|uniref:YopX protein domain-containing protein n=1 Tax=Clostridium sardiniense TaxID=29369 RepID=A0ABS7KWR1_CLOSR|nr:YopX family protein [Clostridium sardiniense]MBY0755043.1 hypothetical protein [Clostridium sardiniense]MDQ0459102.1 hypothetical protein [Clostridium sardiniense]
MKGKELVLKAVNEIDKDKFELIDFTPIMECEEIVGKILGDTTILRPTGMTDNEYNEIYEGDIVEVTVGNLTHKAEIVFEIGSFCIAMREDNLRDLFPDNWNDNVKTLGEIYWEQEFMEDNSIECLKIIGNHYKNKALRLVY